MFLFSFLLFIDEKLSTVVKIPLKQREFLEILTHFVFRTLKKCFKKDSESYKYGLSKPKKLIFHFD